MVATADNREPGPRSGMKSPCAAAWLAWSLWALSLALTALSLILLRLNLSHPNTPIYGPWPYASLWLRPGLAPKPSEEPD
jgi:hypothetical protein